MAVKGPVAPRDPAKKRPFFYVMQEKEIFGAKQPDGRGIQFIYENDNRLINSAQIAGNVTDREMLEFMIASDEIVLPMVKSGNPMSEMILK